MEPGGKPRGGCAVLAMHATGTGADTLFGCCRRLDDAHESGGHSHSFAWAERHDGRNRIARRLPSRRFAGENVRTSPLRCKYGLCLVAPRLIDCAARMDSAEEGRNLGRSFAEQADEDMHEETHKPTISVTLTHGKVRILFAKTIRPSLGSGVLTVCWFGSRGGRRRRSARNDERCAARSRKHLAAPRESNPRMRPLGLFLLALSLLVLSGGGRARAGSRRLRRRRKRGVGERTRRPNTLAITHERRRT